MSTADVADWTRPVAPVTASQAVNDFADWTEVIEVVAGDGSLLPPGVHSPAFVSGSANSGSANSVVVTAPALLAAGNTFFAFAYGATNVATVPSAPNGWTILFQHVLGDTSGQMCVFTKTVQVSEPASYTFTGPIDMSAAIIQVSGVGGTTDGAIGAAYDTVGHFFMQAPAITPTNSNDLWLAVFGSFTGQQANTPLGMTNGPQSFTGGASGISVFYKTLSGTGTVGPATSNTAGTSQSTSLSILL